MQLNIWNLSKPKKKENKKKAVLHQHQWTTTYDPIQGLGGLISL